MSSLYSCGCRATNFGNRYVTMPVLVVVLVHVASMLEPMLPMLPMSTQLIDVSAIVHSMPFYVLSEKATQREEAASKRRERTKRERDLRGPKRAKSERMIVVE